MKFTLPKIYPITDTGISGLSHVEQVERLVDGGAKFIQLREKYASPRDFYESALEVMNFVRDLDVKIIINDRVDIALALKAHGVHLGQDDLPVEHARRLLGPDVIIGFSTHSLEQAMTAVAMPINYVACGPVFPTTTKEDPDAVVGIDRLSMIRSSIGDLPLVAIGGISEKELQSIIKAGADSAAIISAVLIDPTNIAGQYRHLTGIISQ